MDNKQQLAEFYELVRDFDTVMMTTIGESGQMHSRPMATQTPLNDSPIWFVTSLDSLKARDLELDPRVNLGYYRKSDGAYVSVSGRARLEKDPSRVQALWQESWRAWFPNGATDPNLALLHVDPDTANYWKPGSLAAHAYQLAGAYLKGDTVVSQQTKTVAP